MAVVTVSEFAEIVRDRDGRVVQAALGAPLATQTITLAATSAAVSSAWDGRTKLIRIATNGDCHIAFGDSPTATTSNELLSAGQVEFRGVDGATGTKLAAIEA